MVRQWTNISCCIVFSTVCVCKVSLVLGLLFLLSLLGVSHGSSKGCGLTEITKATSSLRCGLCKCYMCSCFIVLRSIFCWANKCTLLSSHWKIARVRYRKGTKEYDLAHKTKWLANGFCGVLFGLLGDLEYFYSILDLPNWSKVEDFCSLCKATATGPLTFTNCALNAPWLKTMWTPKKWLAWPKRSKCPIFTVPGVTALTVMLDYMHAKYLGSDMYQMGSVSCFVHTHFNFYFESLFTFFVAAPWVYTSTLSARSILWHIGVWWSYSQVIISMGWTLKTRSTDYYYYNYYSVCSQGVEALKVRRLSKCGLHELVHVRLCI